MTMTLDTRGGRPPTLSDVARLAGVSQSTASRVVNGSARRVDAEYRERVLDAARRLGYAPNIAAQAVARGASHRIALITGGIADAYFSAMTASIMSAAEKIDLRVSLAVSSRRTERELELVRELRGEHPRAIILAGTGYTDARSDPAVEAELLRYQETGGRVVLISRTDMPFETVYFDNFEGARRLAVEMVARGYRSPLLLGSDLPLRSMQERIEGFTAGFAEAGIAIPPSRVLRPAFHWDGARELVTSLDDSVLASTDLVFAVTDDLALGALNGLRGRGIEMPGRIGVAGFDDITTLRDVVPSLTSVHVPVDEVAAEAIHRATAAPAELRRRVIPTHPVVRASTPPR
ncbi:LacI family DNA-binding transcriptional regulator [Microbacterium paraoxydans]|uniref:LacI family DNA-binding transcriptional regulator n=2 Tax=Microbacterium paraoxydans TaxID=199592 RepID=A0ABS5IM37_9MICO|nr:LacI family DNA-binding transcriptional regulator [Microbacterium paraoxydans]